ncbi:MAG: pyridoxamine 5'-phosphate oxidase family protein [Flavobacteriales bacterium]|nr:pyridoxamine 5'-phosphate oxidase family protein [Flavobacteriales bacterium]
MGNEKTLTGKLAITKFQEIVDHQRTCMMVTELGTYPNNTRPMATGKVDDAGNFLFLTLTTSHKYEELLTDPRTDLHYANPSDQEFLTIHGRAEFLNDKELKKELWSPFANAWVPDGLENPDLRVLKVVPQSGYYWDTSDGKIVAGIKIAIAALTGSLGNDGGEEGKVFM